MWKEISICYIVYNEQYLLPISLGQVVDWAQENEYEIIIINGSPDGASTDNTGKVVKDFMEKYPCLITYVEGTFGTHNWEENWDKVQRNEYLKFASGDFIFQIDADEFYPKKHLYTITEEIDKDENDDITGCRFNNLHFYCDYKHYLENIGKNDNRFTKRTIGCFYDRKNDTNLKDESGITISDSGRVLTLDKVVRFHFGHGMPWEYYKPRVAKFVKRGEEKHFDMKDYDNWKDPRSLKHPGVKVYNGEYPELMQKAINEGNPYFKLWGENRKNET